MRPMMLIAVALMWALVTAHAKTPETAEIICVYARAHCSGHCQGLAGFRLPRRSGR
jgi:hypothetical protein